MDQVQLSRKIPAAVGAVSLALLLGALGFQFIGGLLPCTLCYWQRYTHLGVLAFSGAALWRPSRATFALGFLSSLVAVGMAIFHVGVEKTWWEGLSTCSGEAEDLSSMSGGDLLSMEAPIKVIKCSEVAWDFLGISMAGWNGIISCAAALLWIFAFFPKRKS